MRRAMLLVAAGLAVTAVAEVIVFVLVARWLGLPVAVLLAVATSVLGLLLLRREGVRGWRRFRQGVEAGQPPGVRVADGLVGLAGALLLAVPGLITDVLGVLLLVPPVRWLARRGVRRVAEGRMSSPLAGDVFGPRRVRVRRGRSGEPEGGPPGASGSDASPGPVVEGEIVDPRDGS